MSSGDRLSGLVDYVNVPQTIATIVSANRATLAELDSVYGLEDLWDLLEIHLVDMHNQRLANKSRE